MQTQVDNIGWHMRTCRSRLLKVLQSKLALLQVRKMKKLRAAFWSLSPGSLFPYL